MKHIFLSLTTFALAGGVAAQCEADFDFGASAYGASPDASVGEQFDPGFVGTAYSDVFHVLVPTDASAIDPAFALPLDSIILVNATLIADAGAGATMAFEDVGLQIQCNNGGASSNPCAFPGGAQYCADLVGTPSVAGEFAMSLEIQAWVTVFGIAVPQPYFFDGYLLTISGPDAVEEARAERFAMFPNPANNQVRIELDGTSAVQGLVIRDLAGRVIHRALTGANGSLVVDVSAWAEGIYFVTLEGSAHPWTERLVVSH
jgi:hypothetical protein